VVRADVDIPKLMRSLKAGAKAFGESSQQALVRWSIQTCRELAVETQAWGRSKTKGKQEGAMFGDALNVIAVRSSGQRMTKSRALHTAAEVNEWIEINRTRRRGRTAKLSRFEKKDVSEKVFRSAMRERYKRAGMAKGGWIGAGQVIARRQTGQERINIGRNFLGYTHKHSANGSARLSLNPFKPLSFLTNKASHVSSSHVLRPMAYQQSAIKALRPTINWYRKSLRNKLGK
jgi:hypothetical protein